MAGAFLAGYTVHKGPPGAARLAVLPSPAPSPAQSPSTTARSKQQAVVLGATPTALAVSDCQSSAGPSPGSPSTADTLPALVPPAYATQVEFFRYANLVVLGPSGWSCSADKGAAGSVSLTVQPSRAVTTAQVPPSVTAEFVPAGASQAAGVTCAYFAVPALRSGTCQHPPPSEKVQQVTATVVTVADPAWVVGGLVGSGGSDPVTGVISDPSNSTGSTSGAVAEEACDVSSPPVCPYILEDFMTRDLNLSPVG